MKQNLNETAAGILLVYIQDEIYFSNKQCKGRIPYPRLVLFSFPAWQETQLMDAFKCWAKWIIFGLLCSNNFSKWIKFGYGGNMYMSLYIASYLSDLYLSIYIYHIYNIYYIHKHTYRYNISIYLLNIYKHINLYTPTHIHTHTYIYIYMRKVVGGTFL